MTQDIQYRASILQIRRSVLAGAAALALGAGCDKAVGPPGSGKQDQLLFVGWPAGAAPGGDNDIWRMNADGSDRVNLTDGTAATSATLSLSPDATQVAFYSNQDNCLNVHRMNVDGSGLQLVTVGAFPDVRCNRWPRWSPDGSMIAFTSTRDGNYSAYVASVDGSDQRSVSASVDAGSTAENYVTGWTPDGRVVFESYTQYPDVSQTYVVNPDGTGLEPLFGRTGDHAPHWSPDRSMVAFTRDAPGGTVLYVMNADGSGERQLTSDPGRIWLDFFAYNDCNPWSPDGKHIAFVREVTTAGDYAQMLEAVGVDGSGHRILPGGAELDVNGWFFGWSPDGRVTFADAVDGQLDVFLVNADGTGLLNLTNTSDVNENDVLWIRPRY